MTYAWRPYNCSKLFDIRAFYKRGEEFSIARIHSDDMKVYKLWIPDDPGTYSNCTPVETDDDLTVDDLKNLAAVLIAAKEQA